jgi:hypothetical protein
MPIFPTNVVAVAIAAGIDHDAHDDEDLGD